MRVSSPAPCTDWRLVKAVIVIVAAFCVAFMLAASTASASADPVTRGLLCIHNYEGSWTDSGAPYWGGLQMDLSFQGTYGYKYVRVFGKIIKIRFLDLWGTADHWPIKAQLHAARNAYRVRGWWPWPNTARFCGLI